jgi:hypothetical protein
MSEESMELMKDDWLDEAMALLMGFEMALM